MGKAKEKVYSIYKRVMNPSKSIVEFCEYNNYRYAHLVPDKLYLKCLYKNHLNTKLNLSSPETFTAKIQWLKLYDRRPEYTVMADKATAKQYVADIIGPEYIIPTIGIYDSVEEIPFSQLPDRFVVKCTHDSGSTFVCTGLNKKLNTVFYWYGREWAYKNVKPRIIVEEYIGDKSGKCPLDYKFSCFNGHMEYFKIDYNRFTKRVANYYNKELELQSFGESHAVPDPSIKLELPEHFDEMVALAEKLSAGFPFVRVDFYNINGVIYFGELTFYTSSGIDPFVGDGDLILGKCIQLPKKRKR